MLPKLKLKRKTLLRRQVSSSRPRRRRAAWMCFRCLRELKPRMRRFLMSADFVTIKEDMLSCYNVK